MRKIGISTDCMCDLSADFLREKGVEVMQFYIHTATGRFWNENEITSDNILEYLESGNTFLRSSVPEPEECKTYFEGLLDRYDEVIHITTSDKIGLSHPNARAALELMEDAGKRVTLINSGSISAGLGHMVLLAVALRDSGKTAAEIVGACVSVRKKISGSFIVPNTDYLYRIGYVGQGVKALCDVLGIHPVLYAKNGKFTIKSFRTGSYEKAVMRYIRSELRRSDKIDKKQLFIAHAGCPAKIISRVRDKVEDLNIFDKVTVTRTSAVISSWCGPGTVGVMFVYK